MALMKLPVKQDFERLRHFPNSFLEHHKSLRSKTHPFRRAVLRGMRRTYLQLQEFTTLQKCLSEHLQACRPISIGVVLTRQHSPDVKNNTKNDVSHVILPAPHVGAAGATARSDDRLRRCGVPGNSGST